MSILSILSIFLPMLANHQSPITPVHTVHMVHRVHMVHWVHRPQSPQKKLSISNYQLNCAFGTKRGDLVPIFQARSLSVKKYFDSVPTSRTHPLSILSIFLPMLAYDRLPIHHFAFLSHLCYHTPYNDFSLNHRSTHAG